MTQIFDDAGTDAITGSEIMGILGLSTDDFGLAQNYAKFKDIVGFMKGFSDYRYVLNKITRGKMVDKLDHAWNYVAIAKEKEQKKAKMNELEKKISEVSTFGDDGSTNLLKELSLMHVDMKRDMALIEQEMSLYEK